MTFSLTANSTILPDDEREAFNELVKKEIDACEPQKGVEVLYDKEPKQGRFHFTFSKMTHS